MNLKNKQIDEDDINVLSESENKNQMYNRKKDSSVQVNIVSCKLCDDATINLNCSSVAENGTIVIQWNNGWVIVMYVFQLVVLFALFVCLRYFLKNRNSPLVKTSYSYADTCLLMILCWFCLLPIIHIGELSDELCASMWPMINALFSFYSGLFLTKTSYLRRILKSNVTSGYTGRSMAFSAFVAILQVIIIMTLPFSGFPTPSRFLCPSRMIFAICAIQGNISVVASMTYTWLSLLLLCILSLLEGIKHRRDMQRTRNLAGVAFVGIVTYTCLITCGYLNLQLEDYLLVTSVLSVVYLLNPIVCLAAIYIPTMYLIFTCLRQQRNFQKSAQIMSPKRQSPPGSFPSGYLFSTGNLSDRKSSITHSSDVSYLSFPSSLVYSVRSVRVVSYFDTSVDVHQMYPTQSCESIYDNVPRPPRDIKSRESFLQEFSTQDSSTEKNMDIEHTSEEVQQMISFLKALRSSNV